MSGPATTSRLWLIAAAVWQNLPTVPFAAINILVQLMRKNIKRFQEGPSSLQHALGLLQTRLRMLPHQDGGTWFYMPDKANEFHPFIWFGSLSQFSLRSRRNPNVEMRLEQNGPTNCHGNDEGGLLLVRGAFLSSPAAAAG